MFIIYSNKTSFYFTLFSLFLVGKEVNEAQNRSTILRPFKTCSEMLYVQKNNYISIFKQVNCIKIKTNRNRFNLN